ncbi:hypothetical protein OKW41_006256 [Paraburkholderia sp. UCT70]|uniref:H-NS histone family protein n=1 Tax=Paraburkholderia sp. UCT70 TaxID=2991068 RepID=UPI003D1D71BA
MWIANVKDRSKFLIAGGAGVIGMVAVGDVRNAKATGKKASKAVGATAGKGQQKGPQPAKYADPKSGATWSGRGPAPTWLAGAKDRTKFLIDGVSWVADSGAASKPKTTATKGTATKTALTKKVTVKKVAAKKAVSAKVPAKKAAAKKAPAKKAPHTNVAVPAPVSPAEHGVELTV